MQNTDDMALLRQYAENASEDAFGRLVKRYVNLVYSTAFRHVGNPDLAQEITQVVFVILARKARSLRQGTILSGWLYQTARLTAANLMRSEMRRTQREQEISMQPPSNEQETDVWMELAPFLDAAMGTLSKKDRDAVVLRFFEGRSMQEVGACFGASENAAKKRVTRAVEKLRKFLLKHGVALPETSIAGSISAHSVQAAPAGLAASTLFTVMKGAALTPPAMMLLTGTLKTMTWTTVKTALGFSTIILVATSLVVAGLSAKTPTSTQVEHVEGEATYFECDDQGNETVVDTRGFSVWKSGSKWALSVYDGTIPNDPGSMADCICDGTNIYASSPGAGGKALIGREWVPHENLVAVYPGTIKSFGPFFAPIWWAYCSTGVMDQADTVQNFFSPGIPFQIRELKLQRQASNNATDLMGPTETALYPELATGQAAAFPVAVIRPLAVSKADGSAFVTECQVEVYQLPQLISGPSATNPPAVREKVQLVLYKFGKERSTFPFAPHFPKSTLVSIYQNSFSVDGLRASRTTDYITNVPTAWDRLADRIFGQNTSRPKESLERVPLDNVPLTEAIINLAKLAKINIIFDGRLREFPPFVGLDGKPAPEPSVSIPWASLNPQEALTNLLNQQGLEMWTNSVTSIVRIASTNQSAKPFTTNEISGGKDVDDAIVLAVVPLSTAIKSLASGLDVSFDPKLSGELVGLPARPLLESPITAHWRNVTASQALNALLDSYDLELIQDNPAASSTRVTTRNREP